MSIRFCLNLDYSSFAFVYIKLGTMSFSRITLYQDPLLAFCFVVYFLNRAEVRIFWKYIFFFTVKFKEKVRIEM